MKDDANVYAWAATVDAATSTERLVLMVLAHMLGGSTTGVLTQQAVADVARVSVRTVRRTLAVLERSGDVKIESAHGRPTTIELMVGATPNRTHGPVQPDTVSHSTGHHDRFNRTQCPIQPDTMTGLERAEGASTVSKKIPPPTEGGVGGGFTTTTTTDYVQATDHFAQRRDTTTTTDIDPARFQALAEDIAGRTLNKRGRFMGAGLTSREMVTVRSLIAEHGLAAVEQVVAGMPDRVDQPTAMLAKRMERHVEAQREAERERKRVRRDGLYVAKGPLKPEEISDIDVMAALGITDEDLAS